MRCVVSSCRLDSNQLLNEDITFYSLPKKRKRREAWLEVLSKDGRKPKKTSVVCSKHFLKTDLYVNRKGECRVRRTAVPTIDVQVCRICFATNRNLYSMALSDKLGQAYEVVTGLSIDYEDNLPKFLCYECAQRLLNCLHFRTRSLRAHLILLEAKDLDCITLGSINSIIATDNSLGSNLTMTHNQIDHYDMVIEHIENESIVNDNLELEEEDVSVTNDKALMEKENEVVIKNLSAVYENIVIDIVKEEVDEANPKNRLDDINNDYMECFQKLSVSDDTNIEEETFNNNSHIISDKNNDFMVYLPDLQPPAVNEDIKIEEEEMDQDLDGDTDNIELMGTASLQNNTVYKHIVREENIIIQQGCSNNEGLTKNVVPISNLVEDRVVSERDKIIEQHGFIFEENGIIKRPELDKGSIGMEVKKEAIILKISRNRLEEKESKTLWSSPKVIRAKKEAVVLKISKSRLEEKKSKATNPEVIIEKKEAVVLKISKNRLEEKESKEQRINEGKAENGLNSKDIDKSEGDSNLMNDNTSEVHPYQTRSTLLMKNNSKSQDKQKFKCNLCHYVTTHMKKLQLHSVTHSGEKPYSRHVSKKGSKRNDSSNKHVKKKHLSKEPYVLDGIRKYTKVRGLRKHLTKHFSDNLLKWCEMCTKKFRDKKKLEKYFHYYFGQKLHPSKVYMEGVSIKCNRPTHIRKHSDDKPYSCKYCKNMFSDKRMLKFHLQTIHDSKKPYSCNVCRKYFVSKKMLKLHLITHCGVKPYSRRGDNQDTNTKIPFGKPNIWNCSGW